MPQPQGYKEELEKASGLIVSIQEALFHGSSYCLSLHACAEELEATRRAKYRETRELEPGAHACLGTFRRNFSLPACPCDQILALTAFAAKDGANPLRDSAPGVGEGEAEVPKHGCWFPNLVHDQSRVTIDW